MKSKSKKKSCKTLTLARNYIEKTKDDWNYILPTDFYKNYYPKLINKTNKDFILIDLRDSMSFDQFHIENSINIFWLDLLKEKNLKKLPKTKKIFLICYVGHTSSQALVLLKCLGYDVTSIKFGYGISPDPNVKVAGWLDYDYPVIM
jgi:rhodanese-related sulfurtransferase